MKGNLSDLMKQAQKMQADMQKAQEELANAEILGEAGAGLTGFWYQQISDDSGSGATFGGFKARALGVGPVLSYTGKLGGNDLIAEFKWLHESGVKRRAEGDTLFLKVVMKF